MVDKIKCIFCGNIINNRDYKQHLESNHTYHYLELRNILDIDIEGNTSESIFSRNKELEINKMHTGIFDEFREDKSEYRVDIAANRYKPNNFNVETTTLWDFPQRGSWATHNGKYRGNWSPFIPRNIILRYSQPNDIVLDQFLGSGTTLIETKLLKRRGIGIDINPDALKIAKENLTFNINQEYQPDIYVGDARNLNNLGDLSIDLICTHPPYSNIIKYSKSIKGDLSHYDIEEFLQEMNKVAKESYRVLKNKKYCAILIGDTRRNKNMVPLGFRTMQVFMNAGFHLKEIVIKGQHNCKTTGFWYEKSIKYNFLLIAHEYLLIFIKP